MGIEKTSSNTPKGPNKKTTKSVIRGSKRGVKPKGKRIVSEGIYFDDAERLRLMAGAGDLDATSLWI